MVKRAVALCFVASLAYSQTTQGLISGVVSDARTGVPVAGATVTCANLDAGGRAVSQTGSDGLYACVLIPPGSYSVRIEAHAYEPREIYRVELRVGGRTDLNLPLRLQADLFGPDVMFVGRPAPAVTFYGPDVAYSRLAAVTAASAQQRALESTVSTVIEPASLRRLPFAGRDVYTMLVLQPGVTAETSSARGIGVSIFGQRPTVSNFLLDGIENNNQQVTGPLLTVAPEATAEYRVSIGGFTAEYGGTAGFLANAVTLSGQRQWHGIAYLHHEDERLNANDFQNNREGVPKSKQRDWQGGFQAGGPLPVRGLLVSGAFEYLGNRGERPPADIKVPDPRFAPLEPAAKALLQRFPTPATSPGDGRISNITVVPEVTLNRYSSLARLDSARSQRGDRLFTRFALSRFSWPDFIWYPYPQFNSELTNPVTSIASGWVRPITPTLVNELRAGWTSTNLGWNRPYAEVPTLSVGSIRSPLDKPGDLPPTLLPGSPAFYEFNERSRQAEANDNLTFLRGRHIARFGGTFQFRWADGAMTPGRDGRYSFASIAAFSDDNPSSFEIALDRLRGGHLPEYQREYGSNRVALFAQDSVRVTQKLVLNVGLRYEIFGAPVNRSATSDTIVRFGQGSSTEERIANATLYAGRRLYRTDYNNVAPRAGFAWSAPAGAIVRGSYGIFFDRPFDNLLALRNNSGVVGQYTSLRHDPDYSQPLASVLPSYAGRTFIENGVVKLIAVDPHLATAYAQNFFLGIQKDFGNSLFFEVNTLGSLGRKLITTDVINRDFSTPAGRFNPRLPQLSYRGNQGTSNYNALTALLRYRRRGALLQAAYTWSHTIDNQSDPLARELFDLNFVNLSRLRPQARRATAGFSRQFDTKVDRANADFDQRHNFVAYTHWDFDGKHVLTRNWRAAAVAALRSGLPYSVFGGAVRGVLNQRADLAVDANLARIERPVPGGMQLLDGSVFKPANTTIGNTGRNAFRGPGYYGIDVSGSRVFRTPWLTDSYRLVLRADIFNVLNHANLNTPQNSLDFSGFGSAYFGRSEAETGFPTLIPLRESPRRFQLMLRFEF